ncbi:hypothetical protein GCM10009077_36400 [Roseibium denhamense]|uniref:Uncharacterized protein n=2 Tax=Roseibium denhamense TaxID=76305 RepID=A0ABY1PBB9_9HYPH|nr:hypothetical protein SAMN06265374_3313 [Roseibium denhamense]
MAHSLFEPPPEPIHEKVIRHMRDYRGKRQTKTPNIAERLTAADPALARQAERLDARGRQMLLRVVFTDNA